MTARESLKPPHFSETLALFSKSFQARPCHRRDAKPLLACFHASLSFLLGMAGSAFSANPHGWLVETLPVKTTQVGLTLVEINGFKI